MILNEVIDHAIGGGWGYDEPSAANNHPVVIIRGADFPSVHLQQLGVAPKRFESGRKIASRRLKPGDILLEISGGTKGRPTGRTALITDRLLRQAEVDVIPASFCRLVRVNPRRANPVFVYYVLQDLYNRGGTWQYQNQSTGIANFQFELFREKFEIPELALDEQRAIAEVLGSLDEKIAANTKLANTAVTRLEAHFRLLGLDDELDDSSDFVGLEELLEVNPKVAAPAESEPIYVDMQKLPVSAMSISEWAHRPARGGARFMNGDTLLARITPCLENRKTGYVNFLNEDQVGIGSTEFIVLRSRSGIPKPLSFFVATSRRFRAFAIRHMVGTSGRQRVSALDLTGYTLPKPDDIDLARFGQVSETTVSLLKSLTDENRSLTESRDALLHHLMSGRLRVRDAEKFLRRQYRTV